MPMIIIESLGVKRLGSLMGVTSVFYTAGAALSPIATGRIFDITASYIPAIAAFGSMLIVCALGVLGCVSLQQEERRFAVAAPLLAAGGERAAV